MVKRGKAKTVKSHKNNNGMSKREKLKNDKKEKVCNTLIMQFYSGYYGTLIKRNDTPLC